MGMIYFSNIF